MQHSAIGIHLPDIVSGKAKEGTSGETEISPERHAQHHREVHHIVAPLFPAIKSIVLEILLVGLIFGIGWLLLEENILPPHPFFTLIVLFLLATTLAKILDYLKVVGLLGMLIAGLVVRNGFFLTFNPKWSSNIRLIALAIILLSGGLGLKWERLKAAGATTLLLAFVPAPVEAISVAIVSHFILGLPFLWSFMLGFGVAAVSPAVVVPLMIRRVRG